MGECASLVTSACSGRRKLSAGSGFGIPKSWGSILYKEPAWPFLSKYSDEYVVSFQGTELDDPEMFGFIIAQEPVLLTYESETGSGTVFPSSKGWTKQIVIQEGYALYMTQVIPCIDKMVAALDKLGIVPSFITGHSLGGATATAYAEFLSAGSSVMGTDMFLVTFGAPPTAYGAPSVIPNYEIGVKTMGTPAPVLNYFTTTTGATKGSIRFFHKFDPVPSALLYMNAWEHATEKALLLFDMPTTSCRNAKTPSCAQITSGVTTTTRAPVNWFFDKSTDYAVSQLHDFLCDEYDVIPSGYMFYGKSGYSYFSYMNMFNPMPCAEVLISNVYESLKTNGINLAPGMEPFKPLETFAECTETYLGTIKAYYGTYLASDLEAFRGGKDWEEDWLEHTTFVLAWGLMYVHMTYPNYPLCSTYKGYGSYRFMGGDSPDPAADFIETIKYHLPGFTRGSGSGNLGFGKYSWQSSNQPDFKRMYGGLADFWQDQY